MAKFIIIDIEKDNVATALSNLDKGEIMTMDDGTEIMLSKEIELGHKFALKQIMKDEPVIKYGEIIGIARKDINPGDRVNENNIRSQDFDALKKLGSKNHG